MKLASFIDSDDRKEDNFLLIRLGLALLVFIGHLWTVKEGDMRFNLLGFLAVNGFFIISGFLLSWSLFRDHAPAKYLIKRSLRIYPALGAVLIFTIFVVGVMFTEQNTSSFLKQPETLEYAIKNFVLLIPDIPQTIPKLFSNAAFQFPNAPLWTLKYEVFLYIVLLCIVTFVCTKKMQTRVLVTVILIAFCLFRSDLFDHYLLRLGLCFLIGSLFFWMKKYISLSWLYCSIFVTLLVCAKVAANYDLLAISIYYIVLYLAQGYLIFCAAYLVHVRPLLKFNRLGDYSYGVYIFGYPTQQAVNAVNPDLSMPTYALLTLGITMSLAVLSWHFIEKRLITDWVTGN